MSFKTETEEQQEKYKEVVERLGLDNNSTSIEVIQSGLIDSFNIITRYVYLLECDVVAANDVFYKIGELEEKNQELEKKIEKLENLREEMKDLIDESEADE